VRSEESYGTMPAAPRLALSFNNEQHKKKKYRQSFCMLSPRSDDLNHSNGATATQSYWPTSSNQGLIAATAMHEQ
jgi:hypothetical protein